MILVIINAIKITKIIKGRGYKNAGTLGNALCNLIAKPVTIFWWTKYKGYEINPKNNSSFDDKILLIQAKNKGIRNKIAARLAANVVCLFPNSVVKIAKNVISTSINKLNKVLWELNLKAQTPIKNHP